MAFATVRLPDELYRAKHVRELDRIAIEELGIPGYSLMCSAGEAAYRVLRTRWPEARRLSVVCGVGNNAGDGYVLARHACQEGLQVDVVQIGDPGRLRGDALTASREAAAVGVKPASYSGQQRFYGDVVVDAVFGTGLDREVTDEWREAIEAVNASGHPVLSIDIPSGLAADTGAILGVAVRAQVTVSFIGLKQGLFTCDGPEHSGQVLFHDLTVPEDALGSIAPDATFIDLQSLKAWLLPRHGNASKGLFGHVLVIGGEHGFGGAARMAGEAAARTGAGLVSVAMRSVNTGVCATRPELMCRGVEEPAALETLLERATVVAVGPGLGQQPWGHAMFESALASGLPLVVDADGLNFLAKHPEHRQDWILTPHPGEAARLLASSPGEVQQDRFAAIARLRERYGGVVVLKGAGTLVSSDDGPVGLCRLGNPGMASGGMGDVLTGVIAGLVAQGVPLDDAARLGVWLHARSADLAAGEAERGLLACDLLPYLRRLANP